MATGKPATDRQSGAAGVCGVDDLGPNEFCDRATCTVTCAADCNSNCAGNFECDTGACACICEENITCDAAQGLAFDADACDCVCDAVALACPASTNPNLDSCTCECGTDENGLNNCNDACADTEICNVGTCECRNIIEG